MKTRKAHLKSRNGCINCKKLHTKCDEQGPPCANCVSRNTHLTCMYRATTSQPYTSPNPLVVSGSHNFDQSSSPSRSLSLVQKPSFLGCPPNFTSLLQLELMHRWSTTTYKSFVSVPPDAYFMQIAIPQGGLEYDFLLNGILAVAALEIASTNHSRAAWYARWAMELYNASSGSFRRQLTHIHSENIAWVFVHSSMVALINAALTNVGAVQRSAIESTVTMFELYTGTAMLGRKHVGALTNCPYASSVRYSLNAFFSALPTKLDDETEMAFGRLYALVDAGIAPNLHQIQGVPRLFKSWELMYREAIVQLYRCFLENEKNKLAGFCFAYPTMVGPDFVQGLKDEEPMALILLMFLALLIDRMANTAWWAKDLGIKLVSETTDLLLRSECNLSKLPKFHESVVWANKRLADQRNSIPALE